MKDFINQNKNEHSFFNNPSKNKSKVFFIALFVLIAALFLLLPKIASSEYGKSKIEAYLSSKFNQKVTIKSLDFSFFGEQEIKGIEIQHPDFLHFIKINSISLETSFPSLLISGANKGIFKFQDLNVSLNDQKEENAIQLKNMHGEFSLSPFRIKVDGLSQEKDLEGFFNIDIGLEKVPFQNLSELLEKQELFLSNDSKLHAKVNLQEFPVAFLDLLSSHLNFSSQKTFFSEFLGNKLNLELTQNKSSESEYMDIELTSFSPNLAADLHAKIGSGKIFTTQPGHLILKIDPALFENFKAFNFSLSAPTSLWISLDAFSLPFNAKKKTFDLNQLLFEGKITSEGAELANQNEESEKILLKQLTASISTDEKSEDFFLKLTGEAIENEEPIKIAIETHLNKTLDFKKHKVPPMLIDLTHIPVKMFDQFFDLDETLYLTIGSHADLKMEALILKDHVNLNVNLSSPFVFLSNLSFKIDHYLSMREPAKIIYHLNGSLIEKLAKKHPFFSINSNESLELSFFLDPILLANENETPQGLFSGLLEIPHFLLNAKQNNESLALNNIQIPWEILVDSKKAALQFSSETKGSHDLMKGSFSGEASFQKEDKTYLFDLSFDHQKGEDKKRSLNLKGETANLFKENGTLNTEKLIVNLKGKITHLPIIFSCEVVGFDKSLSEKMEILFGRNLNANILIGLKEENGPIKVEVTGEVGSLDLNAYVQDGFLFLKEPFSSKFKVSPRLGKSILHDLFPLLSGIQDSDQPIEIGVASEGFSFPLKHLDLKKIEIPHGFLSLGHLKFDKSGELANVLSLLLTSSNPDLISVWFTPLYFNMHEGVFNLKRVDLLISNEFPMAAWGRVDLIQDKVRMMIGVSGRALSHAFEIKDLDENFMLQIPFRGTLKDPSIDKKTATARIGALVAQSKGGPKGLVLGTVLSLAGGALSEKRVPPPTTNPLPWAKVDQKQSQSEDKKTHLRKKKLKTNLEKELNKEAGKLMDRFFK